MHKLPWDQVQERIRKYERGDHSCPHELHPVDYMSRLSNQEKSNFYDLFYVALRDNAFRYSDKALLAVGTTTYDDDYWNSLREYFAEHDPTKLPIVERRGEDIDLILLSDNGYYAEMEAHDPKWLKKYLDEAGINYEYTGWRDGNESGTGYLTIALNLESKRVKG